MARVIPNETSWIGWSETAPTDMEAPTVAWIGSAEDWTCFVSSINASSQGNQIPVPDLCSRFERSIAGTVNATFSAEFYRDDEAAGDVPWDTLVRGKKGYFIVSRFKAGFAPGDDPKPEAGDTIEIWPVEVTSRQAGPMSSNTVQTFTVQAAVNVVPAEDAVVAA